MGKKTFVQISFAEDSSDANSLKLLSSAGRKKSLLVSMALEELMATYNLDPNNEEEVKVFINNYKYFKKLSLKAPTTSEKTTETPSISTQTTSAKEENEAFFKVDDGVDLGTTDFSQMRSALAMFGG